MGRATVSMREREQARDSIPPEKTREPAPHFASGSHADLFAEASERRCDVCQTPMPKIEGADDEDEGAGVYIWARGAEIRREEAPLCASCSGVIFAYAIGAIDFDDEE